MNFKSVVVNFNEGGPDYVYNIPPGDEPKPEDIVVTSVNPSFSSRDYGRYDSKMKAARVKCLSNQNSIRYYLQLIPRENFERQKNLTTELQQRNQNMEKAKRRLNELVEKHKQDTIMGDLLRNNSEARHLYAYINGEIDEYDQQV